MSSNSHADTIVLLSIPYTARYMYGVLHSCYGAPISFPKIQYLPDLPLAPVWLSRIPNSQPSPLFRVHAGIPHSGIAEPNEPLASLLCHGSDLVGSMEH